MSGVNSIVFRAAAYFFVLLVLLFPVWIVDLVPMPDFVGHMARISVLATIDENRVLQEFFEIHWDFFPNIAVDVFVLTAANIFSLQVAGKLFISVCVLLWLGGTAWLHFALWGRWSWMPLIAALFVFNTPFFWGFANFIFGSGVAVVGFAAWVATASWHPSLRILLFLPIAIAAYFSHIMGFVILAACILGFECGTALFERPLSVRSTLRRLTYATIPLIPVALIYALVTPHGGNDDTIVFGDIWNSYTRVKHAAGLQFNEPYIAGLVFVAAVLGIGLVTRRIVVDRRMVLLVLGLGLVALLIPVKIFGGALAQIRLPAIVGCLAVASLDVRSGRMMPMLMGVLLASLLVYRTVLVSQEWVNFDKDFKSLSTAMNHITAGSKVVLVVGNAESRKDRNARTVYSRYVDLISVQKSFFTPQVYAWPTLNPLRRTPAYRPLSSNSAYGSKPVEVSDLLDLAQGRNEGRASRYPYLQFWQCVYDYVVLIHLGEQENPAPTILQPERRGDFFTLLSVDRTSNGCT